MNLKNWLIITLTLTVLIFFGVIESQEVSDKRSSNTEVAQPSHIEPSATVVITSKGDYEPAEVTIRPGQAVKWINESDGLIWPGSNPHPAHTDYPGFDPREIIRPGKSWQFTFTKPGHWGYHDHLNPSRRGSVIVTN